MTAAAVLAALANVAGNGGQLAYALTVAFGFLFVCLLLTGFAFLIAWAAAINRIITGIGFWLVCIAMIAASFSGITMPVVGNWPLVTFSFFTGLILILMKAFSSKNSGQSPFAKDQLPPQIIAPREPTQ